MAPPIQPTLIIIWILSQVQAHTHTHPYTHTYNHSQSHNHTYTHSRPHNHTHTCNHSQSHNHNHTHTHTHTQPRPGSHRLLCISAVAVMMGRVRQASLGLGVQPFLLGQGGGMKEMLGGCM